MRVVSIGPAPLTPPSPSRGEGVFSKVHQVYSSENNSQPLAFRSFGHPSSRRVVEECRPRFFNEAGYAYVMVLAAAVVLAILAGTAAILASYDVRHDREEELLFRGLAYERAIQSFYLSNQPGTTPSFPRRLEDLLLDPRFTHQRYLRTLYPDPVGKGWSLVQAPDGGIAGVASQSKERPLKQDNFPDVFSGFTGAQHYSDWIFLYQPGSTTLPGQPATSSSSANSNL
jgi:type II secretory pathway pseudopilin PulG